MYSRNIHIAPSIRLLLAMFNLQAAIADSLKTNWGNLIQKILREQFPDAEFDMTAYQMGDQVFRKALRELQFNEEDASDAVQDFLMYIASAKTDFRKPSKRSPGAANWKQAYRFLLRNLRGRAMSKSFKKFRRIKPSDKELLADLKWKKEQAKLGKFKWDEESDEMMDEYIDKLEEIGEDVSDTAIPPKKLERRGQRVKTLDETFGKRSEEGDAPSGGEHYIPTPETSALGRSLETHTAIKQFMDLIDEHIPDMRKTFSEEEELLFKIIYDYGIGTFGTDLKENMNLSAVMKLMGEEGKETEKREKGVEDVPADLKSKYKNLYDKNKMRWSQYVGKLRGGLLKKIIDYIESHLTSQEFAILRDMFYVDITPKRVREQERAKGQTKVTEQAGKDERSIAHLRWDEQQGTISLTDKRRLETLIDKLTYQGIDKRRMQELERKEITRRLTPVEKDELTGIRNQLKEQSEKIENITPEVSERKLKLKETRQKRKEKLLGKPGEPEEIELTDEDIIQEKQASVYSIACRIAFVELQYGWIF